VNKEKEVMEKDSTSSNGTANHADGNDRIKEICDRLNNEAVYHWSLHSKELFHSNVLGWFCEKYPAVATQVLQRWVPQRDNSEHWVLREKYNLDLVVQLPGLAPLVIENKVFSPPDETQLDRYAEQNVKELEKAEKIEVGALCLLSLSPPNWDNSTYTCSTGDTWQYLSYRDLAVALEEVAHEIAGFDGEVLRRYLVFITLLQELTDEVSVIDDETTFSFNSETKEFLKVARLDSAFGKLRARSTIAAVRESMKGHENFNDITFHASFTNGEPLVEAMLRCANGDELGWQLQGTQWRLAVRTNQYLGKTDELRELRFSYVRENYGEWFDFTEVTKSLGRPVDKQSQKEKKGTFNRYDPNFVYLYRKLEGLTLGDIKTLSERFITQAAKWR
jgi:hypothetical protein